jgi:hypothetical protein
MSRRKSFNCCGRDRARLSETNVVSSAARHMVADASIGLHDFSIVQAWCVCV